MKTVIFGGTFNPLHNAHLEMIEKAQKLYGFTRVILLPTNRPPHKCGAEDAGAQLAMVNRACLTRAEWGVDCCEYESDGVHYTSETVKVLKKRYGAFTFLIGGDSMIDFHTWHKPEEIVKQTPLLVASRRNCGAVKKAAEHYIRAFGASIDIMDFENPLSSSEIRTRCELSLPIDSMVPSFVQGVIDERGIYKRHASLVGLVKGKLSKERFDHTCRTALCGVKLNETAKLPYDDVFAACMLHDVTKESDESVYDALLPQNALDSPVKHAFTAAYFAREMGFGEKVANAVYSHCTGMPNMDALQKLVYLADLLEEGRKFEGVEELRTLAAVDLEKAFLAALKGQYEFLKSGSNEIYPLTIKTYEYYFGGKK